MMITPQRQCLLLTCLCAPEPEAPPPELPRGGPAGERERRGAERAPRSRSCSAAWPAARAASGAGLREKNGPFYVILRGSISGAPGGRSAKFRQLTFFSFLRLQDSIHWRSPKSESRFWRCSRSVPIGIPILAIARSGSIGIPILAMP